MKRAGLERQNLAQLGDGKLGLTEWQLEHYLQQMKIHPCFIPFQSANLSYITIEGSQSVGDIGGCRDMGIS